MFFSFLPKRYYFIKFNREVVLAVEFIAEGVLQREQDKYLKNELAYCELDFSPETVDIMFGDGAKAKNIPRDWFFILE